MRTCYIHIGAPKCGSTSIQKSFFAFRENLAKAGFVYPYDADQRHNILVSMHHPDPAALRFNRRASDSSKNLEERIFQTREKFEADLNRHSACEILLSNEVFLLQAENLAITRMRDYLLKFCDKIVIVVLVRDPFSLMNSRAQEHVKGGIRTYEDVKINPPIFRFQKIDVFRTVFGAENIRVKKMETLVSNGKSLIPSFASLIGLDEKTTDSIPNIRANASLSLEAVLLISELNKLTKSRGNNQQSNETGALFNRALQPKFFRKIGSTKFELPRSSALLKSKELNEQYEYLKNQWKINYSPYQALGNYIEPEPDWNSKTLNALVKSINKLAVENMKIRNNFKRNKVKL